MEEKVEQKVEVRQTRNKPKDYTNFESPRQEIQAKKSIDHDTLIKTPAEAEVKSNSKASKKGESITNDNKSEEMKLNDSEDKGANQKDSSKMDHSASNVNISRNEVIANNQKNHSFNGNQDQSFTSGRFTEQANNYVDKVFDKVMENYTDIINSPSDEEEEEEETDRQDSSNNQKEHINMNQSIEKRVDVESSIEHSVIKLDNSEQGNSLHNQSSTSTIRNMANDYVTNMLGGLS